MKLRCKSARCKKMNRVVVQFLKDGYFRVHSDEPIAFFSVDEKHTEDRVYQHSISSIFLGNVDEVLGSSPIGYFGDGSRGDQIAKVVGELGGTYSEKA